MVEDTNMASSKGLLKANAKKGNMESSGSGAKRCLSCGTTKTPKWRRGPWGARTVCNGCGLRYKRKTKGFHWNLTEGDANPHDTSHDTSTAKASRGDHHKALLIRASPWKIW